MVSPSTRRRSESAERRHGPALEAMYRFIVWLVPTVEKFPRSQKHLLGDRIESTALDVLQSLIDATYTKERSVSLRAANLGLERLRFLILLAMDLQHLDLRRYAYAAAAIDDIGRLVGAWTRQQSTLPASAAKPQD